MEISQPYNITDNITDFLADNNNSNPLQLKLKNKRTERKKTIAQKM